MEIRNVEYFYDKINEKFPELERWEIDKIVKYGLKSYYMHNLYGGDILSKSPYFTMYTGKMFSSNLVFYHYWRTKYKIKFRILYKRNKERFDGKYYFGMTEKEYEEYLSQFNSKGRRRRKVTIKNLYAYKILDECLLDRAKKHFFILYYDTDLGFSFYKKEYETRNIEYIYKRNSKNEIEPI